MGRYVVACEDMWCENPWQQNPCEAHSNAGWNHGMQSTKQYGELMSEYSGPVLQPKLLALQRNYDIHVGQS